MFLNSKFIDWMLLVWLWLSYFFLILYRDNWDAAFMAAVAAAILSVYMWENDG